MTLPFISRESHELDIKALKLEYERKIAELQRNPVSLLEVLNQEEENYYLYAEAQKKAQPLKVLIQMVIGIGIFASLIFRLVIFFFQIEISRLPSSLSGISPIVDFLSKRNVLEIVGDGLALSAGIELIYMLFTDGLDEAVDPLILGTASAILILLSRDTVAENATSILVLSVVLAVLFLVRRIFFKRKLKDEKQPAPISK